MMGLSDPNLHPQMPDDFGEVKHVLVDRTPSKLSLTIFGDHPAGPHGTKSG